jgi:hypothetical protein
LACHAQFFVEALVAPGFGPSGLTLGQVAAHRKRGVGHVQGGTVICFLFRHCSKRHCVGDLLCLLPTGKKSTRIITVLGNAQSEGFQAVVFQLVVEFVQQVDSDDFTVAPFGAQVAWPI